jgi:hypothetical protein
MVSGYIDIPEFGSPYWRDAVATALDLPTNGNLIGEARVTKDTDSIYIWNGTMWVSPGGTGVSSLNGETGALTLTAGTGITITTTPGNIQVISTTSGGTVTSVSVVTANGFAGTVANPTSTPALTLTTTVTGILHGNGTSVAAAVAGDFPILNQNTTGTAANITASSNSTLTTLSALSLPATQLTGTLQAAQEPAHTGDVTNTAGSLVLTLSTVNADVGTFTKFTVNAKGLITAATAFSSADLPTITLTGDVTGAGSGGTIPTTLVATTNSTLTTLSALSLPYSQITGAPAAIMALTGDGTATGPGSAAFTLSTVNGNVGTFGTASQVGTFTVNAKGLITAASNTSIQIAESQVTNLVSDLAGKQATGNYITALTGDVTATGPGSVAATIANNAVTNAKLAQMPANTIKGNNTGSTANAIDLTVTQARAELGVTTGFSFITSGTTFTTAANITTATRFKFTMVGGGGGGAGINTSNRGAVGGGGAGTCILSITGLTANTGYTIAIGAGGTAGAATPTAGGDGGDTTLVIGATTYTAGGGKGGGVGTAGNGGLGGGATNGTINIAGGGGNAVVNVNNVSGRGGNSLLGPGAASVGTTSNGINASGYGGGGSGGQGLAATGGAGSPGAIMVEWTN